MIRVSRSEAGFIMLIVILAIAVMSIIVVGAMNRMVSKTLAGEELARKMRAEEISKGAMWQAYANIAAGQPVNDYFIVLDNRRYNVDYTITPGGGVNGTDLVLVNINY